MSIVRRIDGAILDRVRAFAHRLQRLTGITSWTIARWATCSASIEIILEIGNHAHPFLPTFTPLPWAVLVVDCLLLLVFFYETISISRAEQRLDNESVVLPPSMGSSPGWRLFISVQCMISTLFWLSDKLHPFWAFIHYALFAYSMWFAYYFIAVIPLPRGKSKVREWIENFGKKLVPATARS